MGTHRLAGVAQHGGGIGGHHVRVRLHHLGKALGRGGHAVAGTLQDSTANLVVGGGILTDEQ